MILVDTSLLIEYLRLTNKQQSTYFKLVKQANKDLVVTTTIIQELFIGRSTKKPAEKKRIHALLSQMSILTISPKAAKIAGTLLRDGHMPAAEFADAQIAGVCLDHNLTLATLNPKHFQNIPNLKLHQL